MKGAVIVDNRGFDDLDVSENADLSVGISERGVGLQLVVLPAGAEEFESVVVYMTKRESLGLVVALVGLLVGLARDRPGWHVQRRRVHQ